MRNPIEALERRLLFSVATAPWIDPILSSGTQFTYDVSSNATGATENMTIRALGATSFNGIACSEFDSFQPSDASAGLQKEYVGLDSSGDYVSFGTTSNGSGGGSQTDVYSPYLLALPAQMSANTTYNSADTDTSTDNIAHTTSSQQETETVTLASEKPSPVTVPLGTFDAYQVTNVYTYPSTVAPADTSTVTQWYVPGMGYIKATEVDSNIPNQVVTIAMATFSGTKDHLEFDQQPPAKTAAGKKLAPPIAVDLKDASGNLDTSTTESVTLSFNSFLRAGTGTLKGTLTEPVAGGIATFSNLSVSKDGNYQLLASDTTGDPTALSSKFRIGSTGATLEIVSKTAHPKGVKTGDQILYSVVFHPQAGHTIKTQNLVVTVPSGFTPGGITGGGHRKGNQITWNNLSPVATFDLTVPSAKVLNGLTKVDVSAADNVTYTDHTTDSASTSDTIPLATSRQIVGTVDDIAYRFPQIGNVLTHPLAGVDVYLVDSAGAVVTSSLSNSNGIFAVTAKKAGTYEVVLSTKADQFSSITDDINNGTRAYVGQSVTILPSNTKPIDLGEVALPKTFLNAAATVLSSLNNYTTTTFQGFPQSKVDLFKFDTTAAESALYGLAGTFAKPGPFMNPAALKKGAKTDAWEAAIRMIAGLWEVDQRFTDAFKVTDTVGKALAVTLSVKFVTKVGDFVKNATKKLPFLGKGPNSWLSQTNQLVAQGARIGLFTDIGAEISPALDLAGSALGIPAKKLALFKSEIIGGFFTIARFGFDIVTGLKILDDFGFEGVFNLIRLEFDVAILGGFAGVQVKPLTTGLNAVLFPAKILAAVGSRVTPNMQDVINSLVNNRIGYDTNTDTNKVLSTLGTFDDDLHTRATYALSTLAVFNSVSSLLRGLNGVNFQFIKIGLAYSSNPTIASLQSKTQDAIRNVSDTLQTLLGTGLKAASAGVAIPGMVAGGASIIDQLYNTQFVANIVQTGSDGTKTASGTILPAAPAASSSAQVPQGTESTAARAARISTDAAALVADLQKAAKYVKKANAPRLTNLETQFAKDEQQLFSQDLIPLDQRATALVDQLESSQAQAVGTFDTALTTAQAQTEFLTEQIALWLAAPATGQSPDLDADLSYALTDINAVASQSAAIQSIVARHKIPETLALDISGTPDEATVGSTVTVSVTVTNLASKTSPAGTLSLTSNDGLLTLQSPAALDLPRLAAGASATFTWQALVGTPSDPDFGGVYQIEAATSATTATATGQITATTPTA